MNKKIIKETKYFPIGNRKLQFRAGQWKRCYNLIPYIMIRANPYNETWKDFSIELGFLSWTVGFRIEPND